MGTRLIKRQEYPALLLETPEPPKTLYARGAWPIEDIRYLSVFGSPALTPYAKEACAFLIKGLKGYPISIVSGLSPGTDAFFHTLAHTSGLHSVAVADSGLSDETLSQNGTLDLAHHIEARGGLVLSEYENEYQSHPSDFRSKSRILVGLSHAVLLVEAGEKSGTLVAARLAHEYNRDLLCIPHRIGDIHGYGSHLFIRLGGALVASPLHILEALGIREAETPSSSSLEGNEDILYTLLSSPLSKGNLLHASGLSSKDFHYALSQLELKGFVEERLGFWQRK